MNVIRKALLFCSITDKKIGYEGRAGMESFCPPPNRQDLILPRVHEMSIFSEQCWKREYSGTPTLETMYVGLAGDA
jgi:hypothetical protein